MRGPHREDPGQTDLAQEDPLVQHNNARPRSTLKQRLPVGRAAEKGVEVPGSCSEHPTNAG